MQVRRGLLVLLMLIPLMQGCTKVMVKDAGNMPEPPRNLGKLSVVMAYPTGSIDDPDELETVTVTFNQPMVPLTTLPEEEAAGPLTFDPPMRGKYRWLGTSTLTFTPAEPMPPGMTIKGTVPAGIKSIFNASLQEEYRWEFETLRPALLESIPEKDQCWVAPGSPVYLLFNQPMDPARAESSITLTGIDGKGKKHPAPFSLKSYTASEKTVPEKWKPEHCLVLTPQKPFETGWRYRVEMAEGLKGKSGSLGSSAKSEVAFSIQNIFAFVPSSVKAEIKPDDVLHFRFTNPVVEKDLVRNITFSPEVRMPDYYSDAEYDTANPGFYLRFKPQTKYRVTLSKDLKDKFGNGLGREVSFEFKTTDYDPSVNMSTGSGVIESHSARYLPVSFMNVKSVGLQLSRIDSGTIIPSLNKNILDESEKYQPSSPAVSRTWNVDTPRNEEKYMPLNLNEAMGKDNSAFLLVQLDCSDIYGKYSRYQKALIQVTNIGITGKFSPENNLLWVTSLDTAQPLAGAKVELRDNSNRVLWTGKTDDKGLAETPGWSELGIKKKERWDNPVIWVFASKDKDMAFINSAWGWGISPWAFDIPYTYNKEDRECQGSLFTERGLYKPGEEVKIKGIMREKKRGKWTVSKQKEVTLKVRDSRGGDVLKKTLKLSDYGSFGQIMKLPDNSPTGYYDMELSVKLPGRDIRQIACESFQVYEYEPADFKVTVNSDRKEYVFQDTFRGEVKGWYLFGAPMMNDKVSWKFRLSPYCFKPSGYDDYFFGPLSLDDGYDRDYDEDGAILLGTGEGKLDKKGVVRVEVPLKSEKVKQTMQLTVEGSVKSVNRTELSGTGDYIVHKGDYYIGMRPADSFVESKKNESIRIVAVTPEGRKKAGESIKVEIFRRIWHSVRKTGVDGTKEWVTEKKDEPVRELTVKSKNEPLSVDFTPDKSGYYVVRGTGVDGRQNTIVTEAGFYASGTDYVAWPRGDDDVIQLVKDKESYRPGEKAKIIIKSPYEKAKALVTFEREYIIDRKIVDVNGSADVVVAPIEKDDMPNVFVSVVLIQGRVADEKFSEFGEDLGKPSFKIGYVNLPVVSDDRKIKVSVKADSERYRPGDQVKVSLDIRDYQGKPVQGEICLAAVDTGVLNLINHKTHNYYDAFYGSRPMSVDTSESRLHVIGQRDYGEKGDSSGGGGGLDALSIDVRSNFKTTPYWNPSIITDRNGQASVSFKLPDNLTTFRLMAVADTRDSSFGSGESEFTVTKPLLLKPSHPRIARPRDVFQAGVVVFNGTKEKGDVTVQVETQAEAQNIALTGTSSTTVTIPAGEEKEVLFPFKAQAPGSGKLIFKAKMGNETDGLACTIPVEMPVLTEAVATFNSTDSERTVEKLLIPDAVDPVLGNLSIHTSSTALAGLSGGIDYLLSYPYECLEQKLSRIMPAIVAEDLINEFDLSSNLKGRSYHDFVQSYLDLIKKHQRSSGGLSLWEDSDRENDYLTCYALYAMALAKKKGYRIDQKTADSALNYLKGLLRDDPSKYKKTSDYYTTSECGWAVKAFALYDLCLWGKGDPAYLAAIYDRVDDMPLFSQAMVVKTLHMMDRGGEREKKLIQSFTNKIKMTATSAHFEERDNGSLWWMYSSNVRTTAIILQTLLEVNGEFTEAPKVAKWLTDQQKMGRWSNTQENFYCFHALGTYTELYEKERPDFSLKVKLGIRDLIHEQFRGRQLTVREKKIPMNELKKGQNNDVIFEKKGKGRLYYTMRLRYSPLEKAKSRDEGFAVFKSIEPVEQMTGMNSGILKAGLVYRVTLSIVTPQERTFAVVNDPVPGGFVVVNTDFDTEKGELVRKLQKIRRQEKRKGWGGTFDHWEIYNDRVLLFADVLNAGEHRFTYFVRAPFYGTFAMPSTKAEMMYEPEIFGYSEERSVEIK